MGPDLRRIVIPSMLIWGAHDLIVPIEFRRRMATRMGAEVVALDASHFWPAADNAKPVGADDPGTAAAQAALGRRRRRPRPRWQARQARARRRDRVDR